MIPKIPFLNLLTKNPTDTNCIKRIKTHSSLLLLLFKDVPQIKYVSELLGHKNTAITMRAYEHLLKEQNIEQQGKTLTALNELSK